ncbi:MAG TPA: hypothetical protein VK488_07785 [Gaiellaceae bacterium]|nr:hypothetical protein [Gaiellaceae bacterium]
MRNRLKLGGAFGLMIALAITAVTVAGAASNTRAGRPDRCELGANHIRHVIYLQFDNTHFLRDRQQFASDLEQMPNLRNFLTDNGTLSDNEHTILISHTAGGILSSLTGLYPDRQGQGVSNSYGYFRPNGTVGFSSSFKYWTDLVDGGNPATDPPTPSADPNPNMVNGDSGLPKNTPAPWVPWTRAGCDVGNVSTANAVLENNNSIVFAAGPTVLAAAAPAGATNIRVGSVTNFVVNMHITIDTGANAETAVISHVGTPGAGGTGIDLTAPLANNHASGVPMYGPTATDPTGDMTKVFGEGSPEWTEGRDSQIAPFATAARAKALTDFVGITIHCGSTGGICTGDPHARPDQLPDEPGGYTGFQGLFGAKHVNPAINGGSDVVNDTTGAPILDPFGQPGFPGFDGVHAKVTLGYIAQMQEAGVPITFGYISDAHDNHQNAFPAPPDPNGVYPRASGPGESDYVQTLREYDDAFGTFFQRLRRDGINKSNTLFIVTADENDHFAGGDSSDGTWSHSFCNIDAGQVCPANQIGEVNANLLSLLPTGEPNFSVHNDSAPTVYVNGDPVRTDAALRKLERDTAAAQAIDPYVSGSATPIALFLADKIGEKTLHMVNADPQRTPSFTLFANPDYFLTAGRNSSGNATRFNCPDSAHQAFVCVDYHFAWSHGDATDDIGRTWIGLAGPGVQKLGETSQVWTDHTDIQPTMLALAGLADSYTPDGRVVTQFIEDHDLPHGLRHNTNELTELGLVYKQINAPFGPLALDVLAASTKALASGSSTDDSTYTAISNRIAALTAHRDTLAGQMRDALNQAAFGDHGPSADEIASLTLQGKTLLMQANQLGVAYSP